MKVFQVYDGTEPPREPYFGFMRGVRDLASEYTLVGTTNFMGGAFVPLEEVEEAIRTESGHTLWERARFGRGGYHFDAVRARFLAHHFDRVYLDIDVELFQPIPLKSEVQKAGPGVLVGNGDPDLGLTCWRTYLRKCPRIFFLAPMMFIGLRPLDVPAHLFRHHFACGRYKETL